MFERFFDEGQSIEFQKLIGLGEVSAMSVEVLFESIKFLVRNGRFVLETGMYAVDEKVDS